MVQNGRFFGRQKRQRSSLWCKTVHSRFLGGEDDFVCHSLFYLFDSGSYIQDSSLITTELKNFSLFWMKSNNSWHRKTQKFFWFSVKTFGTSFAQTLRICRSSVTIPCIGNVDMLRVSAFSWMHNRRSERQTSRTWLKFSSVLAVVGCPKRGSSAISSWLFLNVVFHLPNCDLEMQSSLKVFWSIWNVSVAFFPSYT